MIFYFPDAKKVVLEESGVLNEAQPEKPIGTPGTFFAPKAHFVFRSALLTGGIFARQLTAVDDDEISDPDSESIKGGQVNPAAFKCK